VKAPPMLLYVNHKGVDMVVKKVFARGPKRIHVLLKPTNSTKLMDGGHLGQELSAYYPHPM